MIDSESMLERKGLLAITLCESLCIDRSSCSFSTIIFRVTFLRSIVQTLLHRREGGGFRFTPLLSMAFMIEGRLNSSSPEI